MIIDIYLTSFKTCKTSREVPTVGERWRGKESHPKVRLVTVSDVGGVPAGDLMQVSL